MAWTLSLIFIMVYAGSCALWVCQLPEIHTQEGTTTLLPCSFNASQGTLAIGSVTWYRDKVALGKEADLHIWDTQCHDAGVYVCRVEVLGLGVGTGNGTRLLVKKGEALGGGASLTEGPDCLCNSGIPVALIYQPLPLQDLFRQRPSWCSSFELDSMPSASSLWPWVAPSITKANVSSRVRGNGRDGRGSKRAEGGKDRHQEDNSFRTAVLRGSCHLSHQATVILEYNVLLGEPPRRDSRPQ
uniref:Natural cytotoxicity triggering receptor 3 n=1 Tax=Castor canadensis TaxID=51338 RepID=A0A8B7V1W0_CASCN|nr:natural cytotoxicity triggering receptor 3 isoform X1 [Castor canadensis]